MDIGTLDVRRKPTPEGFYQGTFVDVSYKDAKTREGEDIVKARVRVVLKTDNPNVDESTIGKSVFDNIPWTEEMKWKLGVIYAAAFDLAEDDDELSEMTQEKFKTIENKDVQFDIVHDTFTGDDGKPRLMVNAKNYKAVK